MYIFSLIAYSRHAYMHILFHIHLFTFILFILFRTVLVKICTHEYVFMWMEWVRIKTVLNNAQLGRGVESRDSIGLYEHGISVLIRSIDT